MSLVVSYIGEPVAAAGYALVGARVYTPPVDAEAVWDALSAARAQSHLVLINERHVKAVRERFDQLLLEEPIPPLAVVPGVDEDEPVGTAAVQTARRVLGLG